jgi:hypothetical protein
MLKNLISKSFLLKNFAQLSHNSKLLTAVNDDHSDEERCARSHEMAESPGRSCGVATPGAPASTGARRW